jgi:hypothetical protein
MVSWVVRPLFNSLARSGRQLKAGGGEEPQVRSLAEVSLGILFLPRFTFSDAQPPRLLSPTPHCIHPLCKLDFAMSKDTIGYIEDLGGLAPHLITMDLRETLVRPA